VKIVVVGNSVGLRVRPARKKRSQGTFSECLERQLRAEGVRDALVHNRCRSALTVTDLYDDEFEFIVGTSPDAVIIICGINEAVSRPLPRNLYQFINRPRPLSGSIVQCLLRINSGLNRLIFPKIIRLFAFNGWETPESFATYLGAFIDLVYKETRSPCFVLNILPCSNRIENLLPGSQQRIVAFNKGLEKLCESKTDVYLVDIVKLIAINEIGRLMPDGIHMSSELHLKVAEAIKVLIQRNLCC